MLGEAVKIKREKVSGAPRIKEVSFHLEKNKFAPVASRHIENMRKELGAARAVPVIGATPMVYSDATPEMLDALKKSRTALAAEIRKSGVNGVLANASTIRPGEMELLAKELKSGEWEIGFNFWVSRLVLTRK